MKFSEVIKQEISNFKNKDDRKIKRHLLDVYGAVVPLKEIRSFLVKQN